MQIKPLLHSSSFRQAATIAFICLLISSASVFISDALLSNIMKSHVRSMILENLKVQGEKSVFSDSLQLTNTLKALPPIDRRKDHYAFVFDPTGTLLYGEQGALSNGDFLRLKNYHTENVSLLSLTNQDIELLGLLVPLVDGGLYFNAYDIHPMIKQTRIIPLMTGAGLLAILLMILLISLPFSLHNLYRVKHITKTLENYASGDHQVRIQYKDNGDEFAHLSQEINQVLSRTQKLMEEVRCITSHVAHELRTPLTRLQHRLVNLSEQQQLEGKDLNELDQAIKETHQIQRLFRSIMRLSEVETGQVSCNKDSINAHDILNDVCDYYKPLAENLGIQLHCSANRKHHFYADRVLIFQAIANLLDNAIKYAPESSRITLSIESLQGETHIKVTDQGKGIPEDSKELVTQRFKRLSTKQEVFGHGLGLTLIKAIVSLHGGELTMHNNTPGLTVTIRLKTTLT